MANPDTRSLAEQMVTRKALTSIVVALSGTSATSSQLQKGSYTVTSTENCWFRQGASSVAAVVATSGSVFLAAGGQWDLVVENATDEGYIAGIESDTGLGGYLCIIPNE